MNEYPMVKNVEELVSWLHQRLQYRANIRWTLTYRIIDEWFDKEAGRAWTDEYYKYYGLSYVSYNDPGYSEYEAKREEINSRRPEEVRIATYFLEEATTSRRPDFIELSEELYKAIYAVWTKKESRWTRGEKVLTGRLTVPGILKRLGDKTDYKQAIADAQKKEQEATAKRNRNYARKQIREAAIKISELLQKYPELVTKGAYVNEITVGDALLLQDEE